MRSTWARDLAPVIGPLAVTQERAASIRKPGSFVRRHALQDTGDKGGVKAITGAGWDPPHPPRNPLHQWDRLLSRRCSQQRRV